MVQVESLDFHLTIQCLLKSKLIRALHTYLQTYIISKLYKTLNAFFSEFEQWHPFLQVALGSNIIEQCNVHQLKGEPLTFKRVEFKYL